MKILNLLMAMGIVGLAARYMPAFADTAPLAFGVTADSANTPNTVVYRDASGNTSVTVQAGAIDTSKIGAAAVTTAKLADGAVDTAKLGTSAVTAIKIAAGAVDTGKLTFAGSGMTATSVLCVRSDNKIGICTSVVGVTGLCTCN